MEGKFRVSRGRSVRAEGLRFAQGVELPSEMLVEGGSIASRVSSLLKHGFIEPADAPAVDAAPPVDPIEVERAKGRTTVSKWSLDPSDLEDLNLDQLNVLVLERDASIKPFRDEAEARAFLSQDFDLKTLQD